MRIELHPKASAELAAQLDWYELRRTGLRIEFLDTVNAALELIAERPFAWSLWPHPRAAAVGAAVAHTRRRPGYWIGRLSQRIPPQS